MLISVIVPIYYGKCYISGIIKMIEKNIKVANLFSQVELIFVNDSPEEIISEDNIKISDLISPNLIVNEKNEGIHFSRLSGLNKASGKYVIFLDQDDKIEDCYFKCQLQHIGNADMVVANGIAQYPTYDKVLYKYRFFQWTIKHMWFYAKFDCRIISPGQCLIKKDNIPKLWKEKILVNNGSDDYFLWLLMLQNKSYISINRERLYSHIYTSKNTSLSNELMEKSVMEMIEILETNLKPSYIKIIKKRIKNKCKKSLLIRSVEGVNRK